MANVKKNAIKGLTMLKNIKPIEAGMSNSDVEKVVSAVQRVVALTDEQEDRLREIVQNNYINMVNLAASKDQEIDVLKQQLESFKKLADASLDDFLNQLQLTLKDYGTMSAVAQEYGRNWFKALPYSEDAKIMIARALLDLATRYKVEPNPVWTRLVAYDTIYMNMVKYGVIDGTTNETDVEEEDDDA